jgi:hypothetical protein
VFTSVLNRNGFSNSASKHPPSPQIPAFYCAPNSPLANAIIANLVYLEAESRADAGSITDWISAICSAVGAAVAVITVITIYVAARQLLTEHKAYQLGLAEDTLGPWHKNVKTKSLFGLQQQVSTPNITLPLLMKNNWRPTIDCPAWPIYKPGSYLRDVEGAPAKVGWVNFAKSLGIGPQDENLYHMGTQPDLVNDIVPMRWEGIDLVGICTMLGYQSYEDEPSFKTPMSLPMQWSGPWDGCSSARAQTAASLSFEDGVASTTNSRPSSMVSITASLTNPKSTDCVRGLGGPSMGCSS